MLDVPLAELIAKERVRRQMIGFAYSRGLSSAHGLAQPISEQLIYPLEEYALHTPLGTPRPHVSQQTHTHGQHSTVPIAYEDYQQQWALDVEEDRRDRGGLVDSDGRERGNRPKKRYKLGT